MYTILHRIMSPPGADRLNFGQVQFPASRGAARDCRKQGGRVSLGTAATGMPCGPDTISNSCM